MLRKRLAILGSVSALTLLTATASQALQPPTMNLGTLKPQDQWKVGTVNANGMSYCAMVGKFDKQSVLAFARNPVGYTSLAVDFRESLFKPGTQYEVTLKPDSGHVRRLNARASSERSIVVQIGKDDALFSDLTSNGDLALGLPSVDVAFSLSKFSGTYPDLVDCAKGLAPSTAAAAAAPVERVERDALAKEVDSITGQDSPRADKIADASPVATKSAAISKMDAQLDRDAAAEATDGASSRRLIASASPPPDSAADIPSEATAAQKQEQAEIAAAEDVRKAAALKAADKEKQVQIAAVDTAKQKAAEKAVADYARKDESLKAELAAAERKRNTAAEAAAVAPAAGDDATSVKTVRSQLVGMQAQVAALEQQRRAQEAELTQKLAATQQAYEGRIASLQSERDGLKQSLDAALSTATVQRTASEQREKDLQGRLAAAIGAARTGVAQGEGVVARLSAAEEQKKDLAARLAAMDRQNKLLQAALDVQKTQKTASADGVSRAVAAEKIAALAAGHAAETAALQKRLDEANAVYARQTQELDAARVRLAQAEGRKVDVPVSAQTADAGAPALLPSERAELEEYRHGGGRAAQVAAAVVPVQTPGPDAAAQERKMLASTSPALSAPPAIAAPVKPVISENLAQKATPVADVAQKIEPAAGQQPPAIAEVKPAEVKKAEEIAWDAAPAQEPAAAVAAAAVETPAPVLAAAEETVPLPAPGPNRASAFLDKIMAYHRPGAPKTAAPLPEEQIAALNESDKIAVPPAVRKAPVKTAVQKKAAPVIEDKKPATATAATLAETAPAAGSVVHSPVIASVAPVAAAPAAVSLDKLLVSAGEGRVTYVPVTAGPGETIRQWTAGNLTGMIEQQPAARPFGDAVQAYLDRYRGDCHGVKVSLAPAHDSAAGTLATATATCVQPGNAYTSSFVFLQTGATFSAILHTGLPADASAVNKAGDDVATALQSTGGIAETASAAPVSAVPVPTLAPKLIEAHGRGIAPLPKAQKLNISYAPPGGGDFQTVYVQ